LHRPNHPSKTVVFEKVHRNGKVRGKSGLNLSQNALLISASQKARVRLSCERVHDDQTEKDGAHDRTGDAATSAARAEGRASAVIRCRRDPSKPMLIGYARVSISARRAHCEYPRRLKKRPL
jgi:hypothetical protein